MFNRGKKKEAAKVLELAETIDSERGASLIDKAIDPAAGDPNSKVSLDYRDIRLGDRVKDKLNGETGTAVGRQYHLSGCEFLVVERDKDPMGDDIVQNVQRFEMIESRPELHPADESMKGAHVKLGDEVKDKLSGLKGHVVAWAVPLYGSHRIAIDAGIKKDGTLNDLHFFDECRVELVAKKAPPKAAAAKRPAAKSPGGPVTRARRDTLAR